MFFFPQSEGNVFEKILNDVIGKYLWLHFRSEVQEKTLAMFEVGSLSFLALQCGTVKTARRSLSNEELCPHLKF